MYAVEYHVFDRPSITTWIIFLQNAIWDWAKYLLNVVSPCPWTIHQQDYPLGVHWIKQTFYHFISLRIRSKVHHQTFDISRILVGNKVVDHSDVVGAPPVDLMIPANGLGKDNGKTRRKTSKFCGLVRLILEISRW